MAEPAARAGLCSFGEAAWIRAVRAEGSQCLIGSVRPGLSFPASPIPPAQLQQDPAPVPGTVPDSSWAPSGPAAEHLFCHAGLSTAKSCSFPCWGLFLLPSNSPELRGPSSPVRPLPLPHFMSYKKVKFGGWSVGDLWSWFIFLVVFFFGED